jgi:replicative DNA helicase
MEDKEKGKNESGNNDNNYPQRNQRGKSNTSNSGDLSNMVYGKLPPQSIPLEEAVLGAIMTTKDSLSIVLDILRPETFYVEANQHIYRSMLRLFEKSQPIDLLTLTEDLKKQAVLDKVGGTYYLVDLTNRVASAANIEFHARILAQKHIQRELIRASTSIVKDAFEDTTDVFDLLDKAESELFAIAQNNLSRGAETLSSLSAKVLKTLEELSKKEDGLTGVPTGFVDLDRITSGWQPSDLIIVAARPGMGKCLGKGTNVLMYDGSLKKVEDIEVGELLMGDDSTPRKVLSLARGQEKMYWIRQNKAMDYRVNESHILSLKRSRNEGNHKQGDVIDVSVASYLQKSDKWKSNYKGYKVGVSFEEKSTELPPYFLGLWLGDGSSSKPEITTMDAEIVDYIHDFSNGNGYKTTVYAPAEKCPIYAIVGGERGHRGHSLKGVLQELGVLNNKHIPQQFLINSTQKRLELLAGLLDSDGHYLVQSNGYEITQKNKFLAEQIKFLCDTLGFRTSFNAKKASIKSIDYETEVYRVRIYGDIDRIPLKIQRKRAKNWKSPVDWQVTGIKVEFDKVDDYYGFEIDGNKRFLLADMTVTHNTSFTLALARNAAVDFKKPVAMFSLEMSNVQFAQRLISMEAEISGSKLRTGKLESHEWHQLHAAVEKLSDVQIFIDDTPGINVFELRAKCRRLKMQHDIQMIIIDYLQLMSGTGSEGKGSNREQEISTISRALKGLAKELSVPVIALSQLSRAVETRGGTKRPQLSDLRECVTGDTRIFLADGTVSTIESLVGQKAEVLSFSNTTQKLTTQQSELIWSVGKKGVYKVKLASGRSIKCSSEHKLMTLNEWRTVSDLQIEDRVGIARYLPEVRQPLCISDEKIILLGHLVGDGSYLKGQPLRYTTASEDNSKIVKDCAEKEFESVVNRHESKAGTWHQLVFSGNGNRWSPKGLNLWLKEIGIFNQRSHEKHLPDFVFQLSNPKVALLLRHLWATDGTIFTPKEGVRTAPKIAFSTNSEKLAMNVADLLLRFAIVARIKVVNQGKEYKPMYSVDISGKEYQSKFVHLIGAFGEKIAKLELLEAYIENIVPNTNADTLPQEFFDKVKSKMKQSAISQREMANLRGTSYGGTSHFSFTPSRSVAASYAAILQDEALQSLAESDIFWDKVTAIDYIGEEEVFDLSVPETNAWIANGIISHNSGAIEQDADIVSFIYRPEYYGIKEDEEGASLVGVAEIIIAKHRNGALDTVKLKFTDQYAKFGNLDDPLFDSMDKSSFAADPYQDAQTMRFQSKMNTDSKSGGGSKPKFIDDDVPF